MIAAIDGCKDGWLIAMTERWPSDTHVQLSYSPDFNGCIRQSMNCEAVVVDMPIGLPSGPESRECDDQAKQEFPALVNSIFRTPPRPTLKAENPEAFQALHLTLVGKGAGLPVWGIVPKLREVDTLLTSRIELQDRVYEFHPELAWLRMAGQPLKSKHSGIGLLQRINVLSRVCPTWADGLIRIELPSKVKLDDILDALVGLSVAQAIVDRTTPVQRIPGLAPPKDAFGLRMEIWY